MSNENPRKDEIKSFMKIIKTDLKANYADVYTKTEVDQKLVGAMDYKGTKATVSELPTSGNATGDVWHITADGSEWAWNGLAWEELGTAVDLSGYRTASAQDAIDAAQNTAIAEKYTKPVSGIPASDLASGVIPEIPITSIWVNNSEVTPYDGAINLDIPTDYVTSMDFSERTNRAVVPLSYSNGVLSFGSENVPLNLTLALLYNSCNIWFALSSEYLTNVHNEDDVVLFHLTQCKLNANAPSLTLTTYYDGNLYSAKLVPSDAYHMAGALNVIPLLLPSAESNSFGGGN